MNRPKRPAPLIIPKEKPYRFDGWKWIGDKWTPTFKQTKAAKRASRKAWKDQTKRINELDEMLDQRIG